VKSLDAECGINLIFATPTVDNITHGANAKLAEQRGSNSPQNENPAP
jgi:hypothetical protein